MKLLPVQSSTDATKVIWINLDNVTSIIEHPDPGTVAITTSDGTTIPTAYDLKTLITRMHSNAIDTDSATGKLERIFSDLFSSRLNAVVNSAKHS